MTDPDPRVAALAHELLARLELDRDLGVDTLVTSPAPDAATLAQWFKANAAAPDAPRAVPSVAARPQPAYPDPYNPPAPPAPPTPPGPERFVSERPPEPSPPERRPAHPPITRGMPPEPPPLADPALLPVRDAAHTCTRCRLAERRTKVAFGEGAVPADLMFIGEGPGREEDETGRPFVGRAGRLLTRMIEGGLEIPRAEVYIANIVKCRPPGNRDPGHDEVAACFDYLLAQIRCVKPKILIALGKPAGQKLLNRPDATMGSMRGQWHEWQGLPLRVLYHPAYLLRERENAPDGRSLADRKTWEDLKAVKARLAELKAPTT